MRVLTVNCGSSSLKFDLLDATGSGVRRLAGGIVERVGHSPRLVFSSSEGRIDRDVEAGDHAAAFRQAAGVLAEAGLTPGIGAAGFRVVHGGARFRQPALLDDAVLAAIEAAGVLAPLHNRPALAAVRAARAELPATPLVATFDTAYFAGLPEVAAQYALPRDLSARLGIRRFGFHGLAHRYMVERYQALRPEVDKARLITFQLGNGCSATASIDGKAVDTSMGFTPLEGLVMGTRAGDLDPAIPLLLVEREGLPPGRVETILNNQSGLLGLSRRSNDMRDLLQAEAAGDADAALAIDSFCYRARKYLGAYLAVLGGADAVVFGGGIGEHSAAVRGRICSGLEELGLALDASANAEASGGDRRISAPSSRTEAWVVAVDEAAVIARDVVACLQGGAGRGPAGPGG